ncbi:MAG: Nramp family divalent metal transporter [Acidobacteria bacterium]|nr:Nramp family divalent metal transporter [Acidobacteriota bacterium]MDA1236900.1 Nramp family divalent metal transporter [Acidobacteriota bacterium]
MTFRHSITSSKTSLGGILAVGPGLVYLVSSIGPTDLVSNSAAGANFGYSLIWVSLISYVSLFVVLEAMSRYVLVTGESLMAGYQRAGRWIVWMILGFIVLKRHMSNLVHILIMGVALNMIAPLGSPHSEQIWSALICMIGLGLMYWGRYPAVEKASKPLFFIMGGCLILAAVGSRPDLTAVAQGILSPALPESGGFYSSVLVTMSLVGAAVGSLTTLQYSAFMYEKGWRDTSFRRQQRLDLLFAVGGLFVLAAIIQIAAAAVLQPRGLQVENLDDLAPLFEFTLGAWGRVTLGVCLLATVFSTYLGSNTGYALMATDIYRRVVKGRESLGSADPLFRGFLIWFCVSPMYVLWTTWKPVPVVLLTGLMFLVLFPALVFVLLKITNDRNLMGEHTNGWLTNLWLGLLALGIVIGTYQEGASVWLELKAHF